MQDGDYVIHVKGNQIDQSTQPIPAQTYVEQHLRPQDSFPVIGNLSITWIIIAIIAAIAIWSAAVTVKQQSVKVIEMLGKFTKVATAGFSWKLPFFEKVVGVMDLRIQQLTEEISAKTKDNAFISIPVKVQYQVMADKVKEAFYTLLDAPEQMSSYIQNIVRSEAASMSMEDVFQNKGTLETEINKGLNEKFATFGYQIVNVLVDTPVPSANVVESFNRVIASQRLKEAATNEGEAVRIKTVAQAQAEAESLTLKAKAYVEQRKLMSDFYNGLKPEEAAILAGIDYRDMVREVGAKGNSVLIVPSAEAGNNIGNIATALRSNTNV